MAAALILAAGKATRLVGFRDRFAKANVPVGDTTPLRFLLEALGDAFEDVWINLHFKGEQVREEAERWATPGVRLHFLEEPQLLGTGGTLLEMVKRSAGVPELLVNAKMFTDFDFARMRDAAPGTMVLHPPSPLETFGGLRYGEQGNLLGLCARTEVLARGERAAVFTGICRPHEGWLPHLENAQAESGEEPICLVRDGLMPYLHHSPQHAKMWLHEGHWFEISTPERVAAATSLYR